MALIIVNQQDMIFVTGMTKKIKISRTISIEAVVVMKMATFIEMVPVMNMDIVNCHEYGYSQLS